jgi:hypothetical protein
MPPYRDCHDGHDMLDERQDYTRSVRWYELETAQHYAHHQRRGLGR